jgi:DNA-binding NarL/FixJ family response regulator
MVAAMMKLSRRQSQVLSLLSTGIGVEDVAAVLKISDKTVASHVSAVYRKLAVRNRTQALNVARQEGLIGQGRRVA